MAANSHNSNAYTDQEKKFLIGPLLVGTIAVTVFLYVYFTIPSRKYELHESAHAAEQHQGATTHADPDTSKKHPQLEPHEKSQQDKPAEAKH